MKTTYRILILVSLCFLAFTKGIAQVIPVDEDTKQVTYKEVITQEGTAAKMYNQGIEWVNSFYPNPSDVTRVRDPDNGKIEIRHRILVFNLDKDGNKTTQANIVEYVMILEFKEGRYRYTITDFNVKKTSKFPMERWMDKTDPEYVPVCDIYLKQVDEEVLKIIKSLKEGMKPKVIKPDNW
jgi:hypothetical protein